LEQQNNNLASAKVVLALEVDLGKLDHALKLPPPLEKSAAASLADQIAVDLSKLIPGIERAGLCLAAGFYDQTQILAPAYPVFTSLKNLFAESYRGHDFQPSVLSLGAASGQMPNEVLQPELAGAAGPLLLIPFALIHPDRSKVDDLSQQLETVLIEQGQVSADIALMLQEVLGLPVVHARYMTHNDLAALLHVQLGHLGLEILWDVLENQLYQAEKEWFQTRQGNVFYADHDGVDAIFQTFDSWARHEHGLKHEAQEHQLAQAYADYIRVFRQTVLTLQAHQVNIRLHVVEDLAGIQERWQTDKPDPLGSNYWTELAVDGSSEGVVRITEQTHRDVGTVAFTREYVAADGSLLRRENLYPLKVNGLEAVQSLLRQSAVSHTEFAYPGRLCYDQDERCLSSCSSLKDAAQSWH